MTTSPDRTKDLELVQETLSRAIAGVLQLRGPDEVDIDASFADLGLDSVGGIAVATQAAERLGMRVPPVLMFDFPTVRQLAHHLVLVRVHGGAD
ncbi:acyl carrier protein [Asanoa sp. WMMD1127]|uniref:acyl carrier protein n=1 Tax=Asanoa sp. WMMD1127 TaxID=3016107 RepID=UPI0024178E13|nr:acyl carrier protein [Asanoa sp. WMMD1127]MDG4820740.1 acyl carrier protein [Asanoa sp. WMMD1127]